MSISYGQNQGMWLGADPTQPAVAGAAPSAPPMPAVPPMPAGSRLPPLLATAGPGYHPGYHPGTAGEGPAMPVVGGGGAPAPQHDQSVLLDQQQQMIARLMQQNQQLLAGHQQHQQQQPTTGGWPAGVPAPVPAAPMGQYVQQPQYAQQPQAQQYAQPQYAQQPQQYVQAQAHGQQGTVSGHRPVQSNSNLLQEAWAILHAHQTAPAMQVSGAAVSRAVNTNIGGVQMGGFAPSAMHGEVYAAPALTEQHQRLLVETQAPAIGQRDAGVGGAPRLWFGETVGGQAPGLPTFGEGNDVRPFLYNPVQVPYGVNEIYMQPPQ